MPTDTPQDADIDAGPTEITPKELESRAYFVARHPALKGFDLRDPKNLAAYQKAATELEQVAPALSVAQAHEDNWHKMTPAEKQEALAKLMAASPELAPAAPPAPAALPAAPASATTPDAGPAAPLAADPGSPAPTSAAVAPTQGQQPAQPSELAAALEPAGAMLAKSTLADDEYAAKTAELDAKQHAQAITDDNTADKKEKLLGVANQYQTDLQGIDKKYKEKLDGQMAHYRSAVDELRAFTPDIYTDRSTGFQVGSALAIGLTQMGLAMAGSQAPNLAMQQIRDAINRDIQTAQTALEGKRGGVMREGQMLERMREVWGDDKTALLATKAAMMEHVTATAERQLSQKAPEMRAAHADEYIAKLRAERDHLQMQITDTAVKQLDDQRTQDRRLAMMRATTESRNVFKQDASHDKLIETLVPRLALQKAPPVVQKASNGLLAVQRAKEAINKYRDNLDTVPEAIYNTFVSEVAALATGGAPTEGTIHELQTKTMRSKLAAMAGRAANRPQGAQLGAFIKSLDQYVDGLGEVNQATVDDYLAQQVSPFRDRLNEQDKLVLMDQFPGVERVLDPSYKPGSMRAARKAAAAKK